MNRIRSTVPAICRKAGVFSFLAAILLGCTSPNRAAIPPRPGDGAVLSPHKADKLLIHIEKPEYPAIAKLNYIQGPVKLRITVNPDGKVSSVHVIKGEPILAAAAIRTVRKWLYRPYVSTNGPAAFQTNVVVKFELQGSRINRHLPRDPESYLKKQIHPPEVVTRPQAKPAGADFKVRVLVGSNGDVLDVDSPKASASELEQLRRNLRNWKFRPAYWGALAVPWYLTVEVPLNNTLAR